MLSVGAVRPVATAAPLDGAGMMDDCQLHGGLGRTGHYESRSYECRSGYPCFPGCVSGGVR